MSKTQKFIFIASQTLLVATFVLALIAAVHPETRIGLRQTLLNDQRVLVSSAQADLTGAGFPITVAKFKSQHSVFLEIYRSETDGRMTLLEKIELPDARDGYFNFNGQATNLALADIDEDGQFEILAPSFDRDLVGRLNIFKFNAGLNGFERVIR